MRNINFRQGVGIIFLSILAGCAQLNPDLASTGQKKVFATQSETMPKVSSASHGNSILSFVISAEVGETRMLKDAQERESNLITAGNFYQAASDKLCRRFTKETIKSDVKQRTCNPRVACRNHAGDWYQVRQIVNVKQSEKEVVKCAYFYK